MSIYIVNQGFRRGADRYPKGTSLSGTIGAEANRLGLADLDPESTEPPPPAPTPDGTTPDGTDPEGAAPDDTQEADNG